MVHPCPSNIVEQTFGFPCVPPSFSSHWFFAKKLWKAHLVDGFVKASAPIGRIGTSIDLQPVPQGKGRLTWLYKMQRLWRSIHIKHSEMELKGRTCWHVSAWLALVSKRYCKSSDAASHAWQRTLYLGWKFWKWPLISVDECVSTVVSPRCMSSASLAAQVAQWHVHAQSLKW